MRIDPGGRLRGVVDVPGDKSISHRYALLGAMARGTTEIENYSSSIDCRSTLRCLAELGVEVEHEGTSVRLRSEGWRRLQAPRRQLDAGNSGTTIRLLSGILAGRPFTSRIAGDDSLNRRPMRRIIEPLTRMGADIAASRGEFPPLEIRGAELRSVEYAPPVASAQVKSCILLAGLEAEGETVVEEKAATRDHTERALPLFGGSVRVAGLRVAVSGPQELTAARARVPGDISSAAFFLVAALLLPGSEVRFRGVGVNPTRSALLELLERSGAPIERTDLREVGAEPVCDLVVRSGTEFLADFPREIGGDWIPGLIDEIPILAVLATRVPGGVTIRDAGELRKKESDRIAAIVTNLRALGVQVEEWADGFHVEYTPEPEGGEVRTFGDHRIAMAFTVAGLHSRRGVELDDPGCAGVSYPEFFADLQRLQEP
ncbi:MAG: 3-phosphoshikimate 1-carboxyvinyltransferase [Acidobacteriota bacterium]